MDFVLKNPGGNILNVGRDIGYIFQRQVSENEVSFTRPLNRDGYPRFHIYLKANDEDLWLSLHLDQKRPVYKEAHDHAAEYGGVVVENEAQRIKQILS